MENVLEPGKNRKFPMPPRFDLQGHRGARGLKPENTLPSFEVALDATVTSIETDLHLSRDGEVVLCHDPLLSPAIFLPLDAGVPPPGPSAAVRALTLRELRAYRAAGNPHPDRFPDQDDRITPVAQLYARQQGIDPFAVPTLADLFRFAAAYGGDLGEQAGKTLEQRRGARQVWFDLELKRVPFFPEAISDDFTPHSPGLLERRVVETVRAFGLVGRVLVRSFDHRCVRLLRQLEPRLVGAVLVHDTAPVDPGELLRRADAVVYSPTYRFLDEEQVRQVHAIGGRVVPWTVNDPRHWERLLSWGVDGITTDHPDRLAGWLKERYRSGR
jgi:glycerophosphoryl diester phosphodiesterase